MKSEGAGKHAVAEGDLDHIVMGHPGRGHETRHQVRPGVDIVFRVADHGRFAGGAGGRVDTDNLPQRNGKHPIGIVQPEIFLGGKRKLSQIIEGTDLLGIDARFVKFLLVTSN